ncbi:MAG: DUF3021 family protein [Lachnospiraceae bacterium]|nr:DUF3021 family protein [Lachnospiraceae bacterium]
MKEHLRTCLGNFFICVTLINVAILVLGCMLEPDVKFGYEVFAYPLIYGLLGTLPGLIMYSRKELTIKQTIIREVIQMLMVVAIIVGFMFGRYKFVPETLPKIIGVSVSVVIVYVLVTFFGWLIDLRTAGKMTEDLKRFQEKASL